MIRASEDTAKRFALALAGAAIVTPLGFGAAAQQAALTTRQCETAISISTAIVKANTGKMSRELIESFRRFNHSNCDMSTQWKLMHADDERVFGEFRVRIIALRTADAGKPTTLANK